MSDSGPGFVYIVTDSTEELVKIGMSGKPLSRVAILGDRWATFVLECRDHRDALAVEKYAHHILKPFLAKGDEWFRVSVRLARLAVYTARLATEQHGVEVVSTDIVARLMAIPLGIRSVPLVPRKAPL